MHAAGEGIVSKAHTDGGHLGSSEAGLNHHVAPLVHAGFPFREV